jgi:hypothetical protein
LCNANCGARGADCTEHADCCTNYCSPVYHVCDTPS